ncbi:hypothetical protein RHMOL_Rhmol01G0114100 [Rhododendron molle]|uniref:Uncharacterized protein n=1 Tax=Rhododendron molle TaxID=49168 RepID=A0ACC0Q0V4_RHOML|nr:hypothetical protein RHMOL_Rhmol01G0114100 [Rhododendron molle]
MQESKRAAPTPRPRQNPLMVPSKVHMRISWSRSRDLQKPVVRRCSLPFAVVRPFSSVSQHPKSKPSLHIQSLSCFIKLKLETESIGLSEFVIFVLSWSGMNCDACSRTNPDFSGGAGNVKRHWRQGYANYCLRLSSTDKADACTGNPLPGIKGCEKIDETLPFLAQFFQLDPLGVSRKSDGVG